jgi:hypothetical protein
VTRALVSEECGFIAGSDCAFDVYPFCAVQFPEQLADPERPLQVPRPLPGDRRPEPEADLSCTTTDARTAPLEATFPLNLTRLGSVMFPFEMFTSKAYAGSQGPVWVVNARCHGPSNAVLGRDERASTDPTALVQSTPAANTTIFIFLMAQSSCRTSTTKGEAMHYKGNEEAYVPNIVKLRSDRTA